MPPAIDGLVLPSSDGPAINDEYSKVLYEAIVFALRRRLLVLLILALAAGFG